MEREPGQLWSLSLVELKWQGSGEVGFYIVRETRIKWVTGPRESGFLCQVKVVFCAKGKVGYKGILEPSTVPFHSGS